MVNNSLVERLSELSFKHGVDELNPNCEVCAEIISIKKQIEEIIEKAEKHDELINGRYGILELNEKITIQEQQTKQLKDENKVIDLKNAMLENLWESQNKEIQSLKSKNEKLQKVIDEIGNKFKTYPMDGEYDYKDAFCFCREVKSILSKIEKVK